MNSELVAGFGGRHIGSPDHLHFHNLTLGHSIYSRTVSSARLLSALMNWSKLVYGLLGQSNMHMHKTSAPTSQKEVKCT